MDEQGLYCTTAGMVFQDKETLLEHYRSDFHRYNLKRKVAGLPPVSKEWYDARKSQLLGTMDGSVKRTWLEPLTGKRFGSENTYQAFVRSKKYKDLVAKSGQPAPAAVISIAKPSPEEGEPSTSGDAALPRPRPAQGHTTRASLRPTPGVGDAGSEEDMDAGESDGWVTDSGSDEEEPDEGEWVDWDVRRSLMDNHESASMEANLAYMFQKFGFYLPDSEYLTDPEGLIKYLGAKLQHGHIPLYQSGDNPNAKQFRSLHAVQRHMVDTVQCKLLYDGNEDEYAEFYDYSEQPEEGGAGNLAIALGTEDGDTAAGAFELSVPQAGGGTRYLGHREFARYYRQRYKPDRKAALTAAAKVLAEYRRMAVPLLTAQTMERTEKRRAQKAAQQHWSRSQLSLGMARNINDKLPKNVPY